MKDFSSKCATAPERHPALTGIQKGFLMSVVLTVFFGCKPPSTSEDSNSQNQEIFNELRMSLVDTLNQKLAANPVNRPEEIANLFKPVLPSEEGHYARTVTVKETGKSDMVEVTLEETGLPDDAVEGIKTVIDVKKENGSFKVVRIRESYRCYRGHKDWSAERCL